jgi:hypothetical protein
MYGATAPLWLGAPDSQTTPHALANRRDLCLSISHLDVAGLELEEHRDLFLLSISCTA